jgi:hypothetical protein
MATITHQQLTNGARHASSSAGERVIEYDAEHVRHGV